MAVSTLPRSFLATAGGGNAWLLADLCTKQEQNLYLPGQHYIVHTSDVVITFKMQSLQLEITLANIVTIPKIVITTTKVTFSTRGTI